MSNERVSTSKRVFIVEDDRKIAMAMGIRIKASGYDVEAAYDAVTAVRAAREYKPDLILLDISMPGGDGFSLAQKFQNLMGTAGVPIIFITASKKPGLKERAEELGAVGFFEKPYDPNELVNKISNVMNVH
ncbi:MAG: DNA-binding response OmpR family regulator [Enterobacterales bacterium]|jgi:DNA-binding response OmpR family regulator